MLTVKIPYGDSYARYTAAIVILATVGILALLALDPWMPIPRMRALEIFYGVFAVGMLLVPVRVCRRIYTSRQLLALADVSFRPSPVVDRWGTPGPNVLDTVTVELKIGFDVDRDWIVVGDESRGLIPLFRRQTWKTIIGPTPVVIPAWCLWRTLRPEGVVQEV